MNLYVGNLPFGATAEQLAQTFAVYGTVARAKISIDRVTNCSRGFGIVEMLDGGPAALAALHGSEFLGRRLTVNESRLRESRGRLRSFSTSRH